MINRKLIIKKFGSFGRFFLHTKNQDLYIFDDSSNDDFVIKTKLNLLTKEHTLYDDVSGSENSKRVNDLVKSLISQTSSSVIEEFNLSSTQIQALKDTLNLIQGTHLRFFSNDNKLNVTVFNYRQYVHDTNPISEQHMFISELIVNDQFVTNVDFTIRSSTFSKIPSTDYQVECFENKVISFLSLDDDLEFFIRDQMIQEPVIRFFNEQLEKEIVLLLQPKT